MARVACSTFGCPGIAGPGRSKCDLHTPAKRRAADNRKRPNRYPAEYKINRARLLSTNPTCFRCGKPANTADHIIPVDAGGTHDLSNLRPACTGCNSTMGNYYRWNKNRSQ